MVAKAPGANTFVEGEGVERCSVFAWNRGGVRRHRGKIVKAVMEFMKEAGCQRRDDGWDVDGVGVGWNGTWQR